MLANIIVGTVFAGVLIVAFIKTSINIKNNKCGGCSCSSSSKKSKCHK
ncbi:FeoB-associated Cys-rich membrane protein [Anaeromicrobium sediminis]|nr:FeoB-associated Cys-rich membrane protein [Anaeromicrobium sediminis]